MESGGRKNEGRFVYPLHSSDFRQGARECGRFPLERLRLTPVGGVTKSKEGISIVSISSLQEIDAIPYSPKLIDINRES